MNRNAGVRLEKPADCLNTCLNSFLRKITHFAFFKL